MSEFTWDIEPDGLTGKHNLYLGEDQMGPFEVAPDTIALVCALNRLADMVRDVCEAVDRI